MLFVFTYYACFMKWFCSFLFFSIHFLSSFLLFFFFRFSGEVPVRPEVPTKVVAGGIQNQPTEL